MVVPADQWEHFPPEDAELVPVSRAVQQQRVFQVLRYIHEHLSEPLDLATLARVGHLSSTHLVRVFRGLTGESVYQHVKRVRLERAAVCLRITQA
jgi:AraC family transcriptional regulator